LKEQQIIPPSQPATAIASEASCRFVDGQNPTRRRAAPAAERWRLRDALWRWLQRRFPRDMRALYELLDTLDEAALVAQRRLTVPFIRSVLREQEPTAGSSS